MNLFSDFKAKRRENRKKEIESQARQRIGIKDFDGALYFAYDGTPLLPVEDSATPKAMLEPSLRCERTTSSHGSRSLAHAEWRCIKRFCFVPLYSSGCHRYYAVAPFLFPIQCRRHCLKQKPPTFTGKRHSIQNHENYST